MTDKIHSLQKRLISVLFLLTASLLMTGCYYDVAEELYPNQQVCDTSAVTYSSVVRVILQTHCLGCHPASAAQGNVVLATYNDVRTYALNGMLSGVINHQSGYSPMPKGGNKLPDCDIRKIEIWIASGAPNN
jgi:hypothetical protein